MRERGQGLIIMIIVLVLAMIGLFAVCNEDEDEYGIVKVQLVSHEYDGGYDDGGYDDGYERERCYEGDCYDQEYDQWNSDQRNHNRRNRGAFSPGPFDRSPIEMHDVCISLDCSSGREDRERDDRRGGRMEPMSLGCAVPVPFHCDPKPASLFPPSFEGVKSFVLATIKSGIEMGRLFADTTITFVENLLFGIA